MSGELELCLIVAMDRARAIGRDNRLPWRLADDLKFFRRTTTGHMVLMGRKTFESIGKALPGRQNLVLSRNQGFEAAGARVFASLADALAHARGVGGRLFVIGGQQVYEQALPLCRRLYLTRVEAQVEGDAHFPAPDWSEWRLEESQPYAQGPGNEHAFRIEAYIRQG